MCRRTRITARRDDARGSIALATFRTRQAGTLDRRLDAVDARWPGRVGRRARRRCSRRRARGPRWLKARSRGASVGSRPRRRSGTRQTVLPRRLALSTPARLRAVWVLRGVAALWAWRATARSRRWALVRSRTARLRGCGTCSIRKPAATSKLPSSSGSGSAAPSRALTGASHLLRRAVASSIAKRSSSRASDHPASGSVKP
jgi:hypothetical protein